MVIVRLDGRRSSAALIGLAAAVGGWTAHTVIYLLHPGSVGLPDALPAGMARSTHAYMLPLGLVLLAVAGAWGALGVRLWARLGRRLERATQALRAPWRGRRPDVAGDGTTPVRLPAGVASLAVLVLPAQLALYVAQENLERAAAHVPAPGLAVLDARALAVHALVVLVAASVVAPFLAPLVRRAQAVVRCERLVRALLRTFGPTRPCPPHPGTRWTSTPIERFGRHLWGRPPPALLSPAL
jgi:hypothetical protein